MKSKKNPISLGVNIDHIATIRQARLTNYPNLIEAVNLVEAAGADSITLHLREDRRHIQDEDVFALRKVLKTKMNLEMAATTEMIYIAGQIKPHACCLVPERRAELTTEGGLDVLAQISKISKTCAQLSKANIRVSLFIDADKAQIEAAHKAGAPVIELHTGHYANLKDVRDKKLELVKLISAAHYAHEIGLQVDAGHGLHLKNTADIANIEQIVTLNIGHAIIARAIFVGIKKAVFEMKQLISQVRK